VYKDGGSNPQRSSKGAAYLLQWYIMQQLQRSGIKTYDMWGTLSSARRHDTSHPYYGVSLFKTAFNKTITEYCGTLDGVFSKKRYALWCKVIYPLYYRLDRMRHRHFY